MNYKGIVSRAIASSPKLKKNFYPPLFTVSYLRYGKNTGTCKKRSNNPCAYQYPYSSGKGIDMHRVKRICKGVISYPSVTESEQKQVLPLYLALRGTRSTASYGCPVRTVLRTYSTGSAQHGLFHTVGRKKQRGKGKSGVSYLRYGNGVRGIVADQTHTQFSRVSSCQAIPPVQEVEGYTKQAKESHPNTTESLWDQKRPTYPFTAIVGQEEMKLALLLNVIDPKIGGVMIMGDRGTGKSTTVRALIDLLPTIEVVDNDPFNSHPSDAELMSQNVREQVLQGKSLKVIKKKTQMIDLPLGATEDRVCGTIDIERALSEGVKAFEPGLLAKANRGILYVDEVNLLDDHLVDILLDSAASGWNTVEREGISISHPARFILVGSGNPEEGELRPQLLDRFGMHAQIGTVREAELRVKIVEERANFDKSPVDFLALHIEKQKELADKIVAARHLLGAIKIDYDLRVKISQVCGQLNVDGLRGDIVTNRASQALAAFEARTSVTPQDIFRVIPLCLRHRLRKDPLESIDSGNRVREVFKQVFGFMSE